MDQETLERNRKIQAAYRDRNRPRIDHANTARAILVRQNWYSETDPPNLAAAIIGAIGKDCAKELHRELTTRIKEKRR